MLFRNAKRAIPPGTRALLTGDARRGRKKATRNLRTHSWRKRGMAGVLGLALLGGGFATAFGAGGSGGAGGGTGVVDSGGYGVHYYFFDNRQAGVASPQGTGQASIDYFLAQLAPGGDSGFDFTFVGTTGTFNMAQRMQTSCETALAQATQRAIDNGEGTLASRVVGMLWGYSNTFGDGASASVNPAYFNSGLDHWNANGSTGFYWLSLGNLANGQSIPAYVNQLGKDAVASTAASSGTVSTICIALNENEPPDPSVPPNADPTKTVTEGTSADSMVNTTTITTPGGQGGKSLVFTDTIASYGQDYSVGNYHVVNQTTGGDATGLFTFAPADGTANPGTVTATFNPAATSDGIVPGNQDLYVFTFDVTMASPSTSHVSDTAIVSWGDGNPSNDYEKPTPDGDFPTWSFTPDKVWITQDSDGNWVAAIDPSWSNKVSGDTKTFLNGSVLGVAVNGTIAADLAQAPDVVTITDDYTNSDYIWDPTTDPSEVKVYVQEVTDDQKSSVVNIVETGVDATSQAAVTLDAASHTVSVSFAKAYLETLKGAVAALQVTIIVPGVADYANKGVDTPEQIEAGNAQALADFGKTAGGELSFCTNPDGSGGTGGGQLTNSGSQTVNSQTKETNEPYICGYVPPVTKDVLSDPAQGGDQLSIDGKTVTPGQLVQYKKTTTPQYTPSLGNPITSVGIEDTYSQWTTPVKTSIIVTEKTLGILPLAYYKVTWGDANHSVLIMFTDTGRAAILKASVVPTFTVTFEAKVNADAPTGTVVENEWTLILDDSRINSNIVTNPTPDDTPVKDVTTTESTVSVDGKTFLVGETGTYWVTILKDSLSGGSEAYRVAQFGMIDSPDTTVLEIDPDSLVALAPDGTDVIAKFNSLWDGTTLWVGAKLEATYIPATGKTIDQTATTRAGTVYAPNTTSSDLPGYLSVGIDGFDPMNTAVIDSNLVDGAYLIGFNFTVKALTDETVVNQATQVLNGLTSVSNVVTNAVKDIDPTKDVVVNVDDESVDGSTIINGSNFLYQLNSSILPANRAYEQREEWVVTDQFDTTHDYYTAKWAVYAARDLYTDDGQTLVAEQGDRIAGDDFATTVPGLANLFTFDYTDTGVGTLTASQAYWDMASDKIHEQGFTLYVQMLRIAAGDVDNEFTETLDGTERMSNKVTTHTPEETPAIVLEKYDVATGVDMTGAEGLGNRDTTDMALPVDSGDIQIAYLITNTGTVPLTSLTLTDLVTVGDGTVKDIAYPDGFDTMVLQPNETLTIYATVTGITTAHTNVATVTAVPVLPCPVTDEDPWDDTPAMPSDGTCVAETLTVTDPWNAVPDRDISGSIRAQSGGSTLDTGESGVVAVVLLLLGGAGAGVILWRGRANTVS